MKLALQHRVVRAKKDGDNPDAEDVETVDPIELAQMLGEIAVKTVGGITAIIAANKVLNTICEVTIIAAKAKIK
jgi:hypothetical protein